MPNDKTSILYDHYKDTCSIISESIKRRDRLMLFVIIAVGLFAFQTIFPDASNQAVDEFLRFKFGLTIKLNLSFIGNVVWFLLFIFTIRYFQICAFIERQYDYLHKVEDKLNAELKGEVITREGKSYLYKCPKFSDWMCFLYTVALPLILLSVSGIKITGEIQREDSLVPSLMFNVMIFVPLATSITLYLCMLHVGKNKEQVAKKMSRGKKMSLVFLVLVLGGTIWYGLHDVVSLRCPETYLTPEAREKSYILFTKQFVKNNPNGTVEQLIEKRIAFLEAEHCEKTLDFLTGAH